MLLGQLHLNLLEDVSVVSLQGSIQSSITIDYYEAEFIIVCEQSVECFTMELVIAEVQKLIDGSERLEIEVHLLLSFTIFHQNYTAINYETVSRSLLVKLQFYVIG